LGRNIHSHLWVVGTWSHQQLYCRSISYPLGCRKKL
jgi:hypothetical protein